MQHQQKIFERSVFLFHRDLRLVDNIGLNEALGRSMVVIPCFIVDDRQVGKNSYKSENAIQFMGASLRELDESLKKKGSLLQVFFGKTEEIIEHLCLTAKIDAVFANKDYTPFSKKRDALVAKVCQASGVDFLSFEDALLIAPDMLTKKDGAPYTIFTPFWRAASRLDIAMPISRIGNNFYSKKLAGMLTNWIDKIPCEHNFHIAVGGGRKEALAILKNLGSFRNYDGVRDIPGISTTMLSAHNKFGTVSIREVWHRIADILGPHHSLLRQLYWRDFFTHIAYHFPRVFGHAFHQKYDALSWRVSTKDFERWCQGETGFPIVDAGMRELNTTGFMHNRVRMITASFLVKDLHIDWRDGERYFAQKLVDYDPCVNNGNWQWAASTGCDAMPYFRIFNPWLQQKKFDPDAEYIRRWIPELQNAPTKLIHEWYKAHKSLANCSYVTPMLDHDVERLEALVMYKKAR